MLSQPEAVEQTALGADGFLNHLRPNSTWVDCSTVNPSFSKKVAAEAARRNVRFLDAPVSGSRPWRPKENLLSGLEGNVQT